MDIPDAVQHFQAGVNVMVNEGADPSEIAGTLLGIAHQVMLQTYGSQQASEWIAHMASVIAARSGEPDSTATH